MVLIYPRRVDAQGCFESQALKAQRGGFWCHCANDTTHLYDPDDLPEDRALPNWINGDLGLRPCTGDTEGRSRGGLDDVK